MNRIKFPLCLALLAFSPALIWASKSTPAPQPTFSPETFAGLTLRSIGPALMSGRIADIAIDPTRQSTWYVAAGSGGVWKTTNAGTTWSSLFDGQGSYSIGCITLDPKNPSVVWVGTGENVSGRHVGFGDGVYRSLDGGQTWTHMGLAKSEHIAKIIVDPRDSNVIFVASEGPLWSTGGERGVFKSVDGGLTWKTSLFIDPDTGVTDLAMDPMNPEVLYAAAYQRRRHVWNFLAGGPASGIHKSTDGGLTWRRLKTGLPQGSLGKIGLAVSPVDSRRVYATLEGKKDEKGLYRSSDQGESWSKQSSYTSGGTGGHYYQEIYASPHRLDWVYQMDVWMHVSRDGGKSFQRIGEIAKHSDNHALAFDPKNPDYLLAGSDGGLYETWDHGQHWKFVGNLPLTQFYKMAVDNDLPFYNVVGGTQDNNTQLGPSRTLNAQGIRNSDWINTVGGDGYACQIDPTDANIVYSESQNGNLSRFHKDSGELVDIQPWPSPGEPPERWNWDAPIVISPHNPHRLYFGSHRLWRSDDRGDSWRPVSQDLTRNLARYQQPFMNRVWSVDDLHDNRAMSRFSTTTAIAESPLVEGLLYVGTDDGLLSVSEDGGQNWRRIESLPGVPAGYFVNEITASVTQPNEVYVALDNHKMGDYKPYVMKSTDRGVHWSSIAGDLPDRHLVWSVAQDHQAESLLFVGTEFGIFFTLNGGQNWIPLSGGAPTIAFRDLEIQRRENDLVGASFGRGFYILDDYSPLRHLQENDEARLFPVKDPWLYVQPVPLGWPDKANLGSAAFIAPNPEVGAVFTYYLAQEFQTSRSQRKEREDKLTENNEDIPFPGWEALRNEDREDDPTIVLTVRDSDGEVIRRLQGPTSAGFHRLTWDLRRQPMEPTEIEAREIYAPWQLPPKGPFAPPADYTVTLAKLENGVVSPLGESQDFTSRALPGSVAESIDWNALDIFHRQTEDLYRRALGAAELLGEMERNLSFIHQALLSTPNEAAPELLEERRALSLSRADLEETLSGDSILGRFNEPRAPSILGRLYALVYGQWDTTQGPTQTHRRNVDIAAESLGDLEKEVASWVDRLKNLEEKMAGLGSPWTPGRDLGLQQSAP